MPTSKPTDIIPPSSVPPDSTSGLVYVPKLRHSAGDSPSPSPNSLAPPPEGGHLFGASSTLVGFTPLPFIGHHSKSDSMITAGDSTPDRLTVQGLPQSLHKRVSLKVQKKFYRSEKKRAAKEMLSTLKDPSVIVMADYLKVRGIMKGWTKLWCVLKPGVFILYKSQKQKSSHWVGTILLNTTELIERPSKKDGFCFKLYHPLDQSIWATRGPGNESIGAFTQPLPYSCLIFRAPSEVAGRTWMDALELALRCSSLLLKTMSGKEKDSSQANETTSNGDSTGLQMEHYAGTASFRLGDTDNLNESDREKHFNVLQEADLRTDNQSDSESSSLESDEEGEGESGAREMHLRSTAVDEDVIETLYREAPPENISLSGEPVELSEELADENKNIIWHLMKQVRPGMDLSKVVLPTFILEPMSLLEKFSDYYYHADFLAQAAQEEDAYTRLKYVVKWYLSGFYKKPKGLKKPYNPIIGESYRCYWKHPTTGSRTFYIAEQISHHPPVSAFHVTNRREGFSIACTVLAKSKFYGNSVSAAMDASGTLSLLRLGEDYRVTMPYAHAKGIILGSLSMELGGKVTLECERTGYKAELEFKLKPFMGGSDSTSKIVGKLKLGGETLATLDGHWDTEVFIKDKHHGTSESFWKVTPAIVAARLPKYVVSMDQQLPTESERMWARCSEALKQTDQEKATVEKGVLEEAQRREAKERKITGQTWKPHYFEQDISTGCWLYKYADLRPWDGVNDIMQYECDYRIQTKARHKVALFKQSSIMNISAPLGTDGGANVGRRREGRSPGAAHHRQSHRRTASGKRSQRYTTTPSQSSLSDVEGDQNDSATRLPSSSTRGGPGGDSAQHIDSSGGAAALSSAAVVEQLERIQRTLYDLRETYERGTFLQSRDWAILFLILLAQAGFQYLIYFAQHIFEWLFL